MKPHKGIIHGWYAQNIENSYIIWGRSEGHPQFNSRFIHTSLVIKRVGNEIETLNSRYTLGQPAQGGSSVVQIHVRAR